METNGNTSEIFAKMIGESMLPKILEYISKCFSVNPTEKEDRLLVQKEACAHLKVSRQTLNSYERKGTIQAIRKVPGGKPLYRVSDLNSIACYGKMAK